MHIKSQGVLLHSIPYLGKSRIFKVFTEDSGLITLMARKTTLSPFCIAEWVYQKKQGEIFTFVEGSLTDGLIGLRQSYLAITAAGSIAQDLLRTQLPFKSTPCLYNLLCVYLKKILHFEFPVILAASFRLKLLIYEGLLALQSQCSYCERAATAFLEGASVCSAHVSLSSIQFTTSEWQALHTLALGRKFSLMENIDHSSFFQEKIGLLFEERLKH